MQRSFETPIWTSATAIADGYHVLLQRETDGTFWGRTVELPTALGDGPSAAECVKSVLHAAALAVATMLENGQEPPRASIEKRQEQVNIRLTLEEKLRVEALADKAGFRSISDYIRAMALRQSA